jgi:cytochrome P450/deferrochelatase/peroxidase EfeB
MSRWKYAALMSGSPGTILPEVDQSRPFDLTRLKARGWTGAVSASLYRKLLGPLLRVLQVVAPVARFGGLTVITRDADVRAVLADPHSFPTPFGPEMKALAGGDTFLLGLDGPEHERQKAILLKLIRPDRDIDFIERTSRAFADALLDAGKGTIDAQRDLITRVAAETCCRYFGFAPKDVDAFADWTIASSNFLFADPLGKPLAAELAATAGARLRTLADNALRSAAGPASGASDTLAARLVRMETEPDGPTRGESRAILIGLSVGFVPTNALAGGKMLGLLQRNRRAREAAIAAARSGDRSAMRRILLEAGRLDPALAPGQWRWCPRDVEIGESSGSKRRIRGGTVVLVSTMAALRDPRAWPEPSRFRTDRQGEPELLFGHLGHTCLGRELALAQIAPTLTALLSRPGIERSLPRTRLAWLGPYPEQAIVTYHHPAADPQSEGRDQAAIVFAIPVPGGSARALNQAIDGIMAIAPWRKALDATGIVHFASLTAIETSTGKDAQTLLLIELNCDGTAQESGPVAINALGAPLRQVFEAAGIDVGPNLWRFVSAHRVAMHGKPWGATALNFFGLPGLSVNEIARQAALSDYALEAVNAYQRRELGRSSRPTLVLDHVRRLIRGDPALAGKEIWQDLIRRGAQFDTLLLKPRGRQLSLSHWGEENRKSAWRKVLRSALLVRSGAAFAALWLFASAMLFMVLGPEADRGALLLSLPWLALQGLISAAALLAIVGAAILLTLRWKEDHDPVDRERASLAQLRELAEREDLPGHEKNHITVLTTLKLGVLRRFTLTFALWTIGQLVTHFYRPGFVLTMGTIQFARWVRLPGTNTLLFQSNYDGSWESYLEDFITRAHAGQTLVWSNCEGFPRTRLMTKGGAEDGDSFKHYVRRKQVPTAFWYSRFPALTADRIRRNALIHDGLSRATSESEAREWLSLFGSAPRVENEVESEEIQSLLFNGFGKLPKATFMLFALPQDRQKASAWLQALTGFRVHDHAGSAKAVLHSTFLDEEGALGSRYRLAFGESDPKHSAVAIGFTARGLKRFLGERHSALASLPGPFAMGMEERAARLGDHGLDAPDGWRWSDHDSRAEGVDVMLALYSVSPKEHAAECDLHRHLAASFGLILIDEQAADPLDPDGFPKDHFGFRDGIVQPVIAGTLKASRDRNPGDLIAAGEMLCGYRNAQGFFPPPVTVRAEEDQHDILPNLPPSAERFPRFGRGDRGSDSEAGLRDFGRNGSFMAVRVLQQHPRTFDKACDQAAATVRATYKQVEGAIRVPIDKDWVAAKLVGRWRSGASLIGNPTDPHQGQSLAEGGPGYELRKEDYVLAFGRDDPHGFQCPLGAHVRRANPRDSELPGDALQIGIVNRHRLLRRGRNYRRPAGSDGHDEKGLFFIALCEDLERQFEFVQRQWLQSNSFHGLADEKDPLVGQCPPNASTFTVPTAGGAISITGLSAFTTVRAGGYFFLPSRSALLYLAGADV